MVSSQYSMTLIYKNPQLQTQPGTFSWRVASCGIVTTCISSFCVIRCERKKPRIWQGFFSFGDNFMISFQEKTAQSLH
jgi:hypothetical protein